MPKRLCPFNENFSQLKTHVDMRHVGKEAYAKEVYEKTRQMMLAGAVKARKDELSKKNNNTTDNSRGKVNIGPVFKVLKEKSGCYFCKHKTSINPLISCCYCGKSICSNSCSRTCVQCGYQFCPSCCEINYDYLDEKILCVTCT